MVISAVHLGNISPLQPKTGKSSPALFQGNTKWTKIVVPNEKWLSKRKSVVIFSGFATSATAEEVTHGIDGSPLTAIVTGASSGIGLESARVLALRGVHVIMGVRNMASAAKVKETIVMEIPQAKVDAMELDLTSLLSVRRFAHNFTSSYPTLNILINNAGIMAPPFELSTDNIELQFATNYLGHFLLANLLLDTMKKTARETKREGRIVNVTSEAHHFGYREGIRFDRLNDREGYHRWGAYGQSKLANILHSNELTSRLKEESVEITANSLHPGIVSTNLFRHLGVSPGNLGIFEGFIGALSSLVLKDVRQGASTTCYVALHPEVKGISGEYFSDNNLAKASSRASDTNLARKLWEFSLDLTTA